MDLRLEGCVAVVTGASRGIGRAFVERFLDERCNVVGTGRSSSTLPAGGSAGTTMTYVKGDMLDSGFPAMVINVAMEQHGRVDVLVNNAAEYSRKPFAEVGAEDLERLFKLKMVGYFGMARAAIPHLENSSHGAILNIAGLAAVLPAPLALQAGVVNASVINFTQYLAAEVAPLGIRVNAISPGATRTQRFDDRVQARVEAERISASEAVRGLSAKSLLGRPLEPSEVANLGVFMCSPAGSGLTGAHVLMDGGRTLRR